jgi:hypothetical protein
MTIDSVILHEDSLCRIEQSTRVPAQTHRH